MEKCRDIISAWNDPQSTKSTNRHRRSARHGALFVLKILILGQIDRRVEKGETLSPVAQLQTRCIYEKVVNVMETWKDVVGYEGYYQVSNRGRVKALERIDSNNRRHFEHILAQGKRPNGYLCVHLSKANNAKWFLVHRLVAIAFVEKKEGCDIVNHLDNNPANNNTDNLEWTTYKGNMQWAAKQGRMHGDPTNFLKASAKRRKAVIATDAKGSRMFFESQAEAAKALNIRSSHIAAACRKEYGYKTIGGYAFEYFHEEDKEKAIPRKIGRTKEELTELKRQRMMGNKLMIGRKLSAETKKKLSEVSSKKISQYTVNGLFIASYKSAREAEEKTGFSHCADVANSKRKTAGGYVWKWG